MIQALSEKITQMIFDLNINQESYEIHRYGIEVLIATSINLLLIFIGGIILDAIPEALIYILSFWFIRKFSGGFHCKTNFSCITTNVLLYYIYFIIHPLFNTYALFIDFLAILVFIAICPINNRKCTKENRNKYKYISIITLCFYTLLSYCGFYKSMLTYVIFLVTLFMIVCIGKYEENRL